MEVRSPFQVTVSGPGEVEFVIHIPVSIPVNPSSKQRSATGNQLLFNESPITYALPRFLQVKKANSLVTTATRRLFAATGLLKVAERGHPGTGKLQLLTTTYAYWTMCELDEGPAETWVWPAKNVSTLTNSTARTADPCMIRILFITIPLRLSYLHREQDERLNLTAKTSLIEQISRFSFHFSHTLHLEYRIVPKA